MNYAYHFDCGGRKWFHFLDIVTNWTDAKNTFHREGTVTKPLDRLISYLPMKIDSETGAQVLDLNRLQAVLDFLVFEGLLTKRDGGFMKDGFEISEKGRWHFSRLVVNEEY